MPNYVCEECGNAIDASFVEETWQGSSGEVRVRPASVECHADEHQGSPFQMRREEDADD